MIEDILNLHQKRNRKTFKIKNCTFCTVQTVDKVKFFTSLQFL